MIKTTEILEHKLLSNKKIKLIWFDYEQNKVFTAIFDIEQINI